MIDVDETLWPLLLLRYRGAVTQEQLDEMATRLSRMLERKQPYVSIVDSRTSEGMSPAQRQQQADWMKQHDAALRQYCLGMALIITSPVARLTMTVITVLRPFPVPHLVTPSMQEAAAWAADRLQAAGLVPQAARVRTVHGPR